ncbi:MAG TPA: deoxyribodipyrimidine photolyase [Myxococcales bacterium]
MKLDSVPAARVQPIREAPVRAEGDYILYWMTASRRAGWSFALQRALDWCVELKKPLLVLEGLRAGHRWACDRFHRFVLDGMADNAARFAEAGAGYLGYVEPRRRAGRGLLAALAERACVVVTDDFPEFFLPFAVEAALPQVPVRFERVDSAGLLPMRVPGRTFTSARFFRLYLQRNLKAQLVAPAANPFARRRIPRFVRLPRQIASRWPSESRIGRLPIDHGVGPVAGLQGGSRAAGRVLADFLDRKLERYAQDHNSPDADIGSGLSPYLHFGHVSTHEVLAALAKRTGWTEDSIDEKPRGGSRGWWGLDENGEAFLDELVVWRELGFNFCAHRSDAGELESLPRWALASLRAHQKDKREFVYSLEEFEQAATHDELWNAAQRQLVREGRIHNYLRMLWGKKVLEWTRTPEDALEILVELNNKYALDGRDPNSYSGILWVFGRYDRPWFERPIFGNVRFMSSQATRRKVPLKGFLAKFGPGDPKS